MAKDRWHELCDSVAEDDDLATWEDADYWTERKLYFWHRYIDITTRAMVGRAKWPAELAYVDLFAGAGVCTLKETGKRIPGVGVYRRECREAIHQDCGMREKPCARGSVPNASSENACCGPMPRAGR